MKLIAGFLLATLFLGCSSPSSVIQTDKAHPSLEMDGKYVKVSGKTVSPFEVPEILERHGISHNTIIHIRVNQLDHLKEAQAFRIILARNGYSRTALVTKEHAEAWSDESKRRSNQHKSTPHQQRPSIRYRSAYE